MGGPGEEIHGHIGDIFGDPIFFGPDPDDPYVDNYIDPTTTTTTVTFSEVVTATMQNDALEGSSSNTNFTMAQGTTLGGTDTVTDQGGTDGMTFENLNNVNLQLVLGGTDTATVRDGLTFGAGNTVATVNFTNIENLYLQDSVGGASDKLAIPLSGSGTSGAIAGTSSADTITLAGQSYTNSTIWGQQGDDTLTGGSGGDSIYGGAGADTIRGNDGQDHAYGGDGADIIIFTDESQYGANSAANKHDFVHGFTTGSDKLQFSAANFAGITENQAITKGTDRADVNTLIVTDAQGWLGVAPAAVNTTQRWLYNKTTGSLFFDQDGSDGEAQILVTALLDAADTPITDLAAADIVAIA
jgi:Ca2+-binding RTX toxin-like protein